MSFSVHILMPGDLAYYDTFTGMVPCKYLGLTDGGRARIRLTANRGAYKRGETFSASALCVVSRDQYRPSRGTIIGRTEFH